MKPLLLGWCCAACLLAPVTAPAASRTPAPARPARATVLDTETRLDVNRMSLVVNNVGMLGYDVVMGNAGLWYPRGDLKTLLFASGLWLGANVGGQLRMAVAEYSTEYEPGTMVGTSPGSPSLPEHRVWKVRRWSGDPQDTAHVERAPGGSQVDVLVHHAWSEYMAGAVPHGAPWRLYRLPDTSTPDPADSLDVPGPDVLGDLMTWCVFNDADPANHTNIVGATLPLGAEVEQLVFAFDDPGPAGDMAFVRWRVRNHGATAWTSLRAGFWADPDIGGAGFMDDKAGCDSVGSTGFSYNGDASDVDYGSRPPVFAIRLLGSSPAPAPGTPAGLYAFRSYIGGTDPNNATEGYHELAGVNGDGSPMLDPNGDPTRYQFSGSPAAGAGWLDPLVADKRFLASWAPRDVAVGDSLELWAAIVVTQGDDLLSGVSQAPCRSDYARDLWASGFARPFPPDPCTSMRNCPRSIAYWLDQCTPPGSLTSQQLAAIATVADQWSVTLDFGGTPLAGFAATLGAAADARQRALGEYAALLANRAASYTSQQPVGEAPIVLSPLTPVACPGVPAVHVGELLATAAQQREVTGTYLNLVADHRRALEGVDFGFAAFGGGAASMYDFFSTGFDPVAQPDSFPAAVRLVFDAAHPQKAYRYLRAQLPDGSMPQAGRGYTYGGFVDVPFEVRDTLTGEPLDVAFVEKVITDDAGTIQPAGVQPASFDSTWTPSADAFGDREYVFVVRRPYTGAPRPEFAVDGAPNVPELPWLFALAARLRSAGDVIDAGDAFEFGFGYPPTPGVDAVLRDLASLPLSDPDVAARYQQIADCLGAINRAETVGPVCDEPTPALVSLVAAEAEPGRVRVEWRVSEPGAVTAERRAAGGEWSALATLLPDGAGRVLLEDREVEAGGRYAYRLRLASGPAGEVSVEVPAHFRLALAGFRPNPVRGLPAVAFTLASREPARLEVLDVAGRRVHAQAVERPEPGARVLALAGLRLAPGVYVVRLQQGGVRLATRGVVLGD